MFLCDEKMGHQFAMFIKLHVPILFCKDFSGRGEGGESLIYKLWLSNLFTTQSELNSNAMKLRVEG